MLNSPLRYDAMHSETMFFDSWKIIVERYADRSNILGADLKDEPTLATVSRTCDAIVVRKYDILVMGMQCIAVECWIPCY